MDVLRMAAMFGTLASVTAENEEDAVEREASIYFRTPGLIKPEDWDQLSLKEKKRRLEGVRKLGLSKEA